MKLSQVSEEFRKVLVNAGLERMIAFVDLDFFHATTFDLINEPETRQAFTDPERNKEGHIYEIVRQQVEAATTRFLKYGDGRGYTAPIFSAMVEITGVGMFAPGIVKLSLSMIEEEDKKRFREFRQKLNAFLISKVAGYQLVRERLGVLASHITIGYVMNSISNEQIDSFVDCLKCINQKFEGKGEYNSIKFKMTQGVVTQFKNMDQYTPLHLTSGSFDITDKAVKNNNWFNKTPAEMQEANNKMCTCCKVQTFKISLIYDVWQVYFHSLLVKPSL